MTMIEGLPVTRIPRPAARILLLDRAGRVLLFRFDPSDRPPFWCTPGGALDPGETHAQAARRELLEETGIAADPGPEIAQRMAEFITIEGVPVTADERYYLIRIDGDAPALDISGHTPLERSVMRSWRWFGREELAGLGEQVFPEDVFALADAAVAARDKGPSEGPVRSRAVRRGRMKTAIAVAAVLLLIAGAIYLGSPYYAVRALRNAAVDGDTDALAQRVDFPAVRESLKAQVAAAIVTKMHKDPDAHDDPLADLGAAILPALADRLVDAFVTPDGIAALIRGQKLTDRNTAGPNPDVEARSGYVSLDRFRVRLRNARRGEDGPSFVLERRGFASWTLVRIGLPPKLLEDKQ